MEGNSFSRDDVDESCLVWSPCTFNCVLKPGANVGTVRPLEKWAKGNGIEEVCKGNARLSLSS
jgi:hypothetical protein